MKNISWEETQKRYREAKPHRGMKEVLDAYLAKNEQENAPVEEVGIPEKE